MTDAEYLCSIAQYLSARHNEDGGNRLRRIAEGHQRMIAELDAWRAATGAAVESFEAIVMAHQ